MTDESNDRKDGIPNRNPPNKEEEGGKEIKQVAFSSTGAGEESKGAGDESEEQTKMTPELTESSPLIEQASKFLQDSRILKAPKDRKAAFLSSKGVPEPIIEALLQSPNLDVAPAADVTTSTEESSLPSLGPTSLQSSSSESSSQPSTPIILTYPEFLAQGMARRGPAPLVTNSGVAVTAYVAAASASAIYGISNFLVEPMITSLTAARHNFFQHTSSKLDIFNEKLSNLVSTDTAPTATATTSLNTGSEYDTKSKTPGLNFSCTPSNVNTTSNTTSNTVTRLQNLSKNLHSLSSFNESDLKRTSSLSSEVYHLQNYLNGLQNDATSSNIRSRSLRPVANKNNSSNYQKEDSINLFSSNVRSFKGVLLAPKQSSAF